MSSAGGGATGRANVQVVLPSRSTSTKPAPSHMSVSTKEDALGAWEENILGSTDVAALGAQRRLRFNMCEHTSRSSNHQFHTKHRNTKAKWVAMHARAVEQFEVIVCTAIDKESIFA